MANNVYLKDGRNMRIYSCWRSKDAYYRRDATVYYHVVAVWRRGWEREFGSEI